MWVWESKDLPVNKNVVVLRLLDEVHKLASGVILGEVFWLLILTTLSKTLVCVKNLICLHLPLFVFVCALIYLLTP